MDSRLKGYTIFISVSVIALITLLVVYINGSGSGAAKPSVSSGQEPVADTAIGPNLSDEQLSSFLNDDTFFDHENIVDVPEIEAVPRLYIQASSVWKDIRVKVLDESGRVVTGQSFYINVDGLGEYKDVDSDGLITIPAMESGDYYVSLKNIDGYVVPSEPLRVSVKDQLEYQVISDISYYIYNESEIDAAQEDTGTQEALATADDTEDKTIKKSDKSSFGIDVSAYQGDIDWNRVKESGVEFAIIRAGYRGSKTGVLVEDTYFKKNLQGAREAGIQVGVYFFTQATNEMEAVEEASMIVSLLENSKIDYPIFIDTEGAGGNGRADLLDADTRTAVCKAFCKTIDSAGYHGGVYASRSWYYRNLNASELEEFVIWDAEYVGTPQYTGKYDMWQYSSSGLIDGINTRVDLDVSYIEVN